MVEDSVDDYPDADEIASMLRLSLGLFVRRLKQSIEPDELTTPELSALSRLERGGPATVSDLARAEQITPQGVTTTVSNLQERGFVARRRDPNDRRRVLMSMTEAGREALGSKRSAMTRQIAKVLTDAFTREELLAMRTAIHLIDRLGEQL